MSPLYVLPSRTDPDDDVGDVASFSALDAVEIKNLTSTFTQSSVCDAQDCQYFRIVGKSASHPRRPHLHIAMSIFGKSDNPDVREASELV
jgi:hypothetical protein